MHAAYARSTDLGGDAVWHESLPQRQPGDATRMARIPEPSLSSRTETSVYGARSGPNWSAIIAIVALHALALGALLSYRAVYLKPVRKPPLVVELLNLPKPPPPVPAVAAPAESPPLEQPPRVSEVIAPQPIADVPARAAPIVAAPPPPAPRNVAPAPAPAVAAPPAPLSVADLSSKMIAGKPPRYPIESRRKREQGTVVLAVLVGTDGAVSEVGVSRSSGFDRLDKAALDAVRRWRWSPTLRDGQPVLVRGYVDIPFVLAG